jgi:DNA-binding transcriptional MerR regulator
MGLLKTIGEVAAHFGASRDRIAYLVRSRGIKPAARAGGYRLFDARAVARIERELTAIRKQREKNLNGCADR